VTLNARQALTNGYASLTSEDGANVFSVLLVFNLVYGTVSQSFKQQLLAAQTALPGARFPPPFDVSVLRLELPVSLLALLTVGAVLGNEIVRFWAIQLFADRPTPTVRSRLAVLVPVGGGFALLVYGLRQLLPFLWIGEAMRHQMRVTFAIGIAVAPLLAVTVYLRQEIALTENDVTETVRNSVARFRDGMVPVFGLLVVLALLSQLSILPAAVISRVITLRSGTAPAILVDILNRILAAGVSTFSIATITDAYLQVSNTAAEPSEADDSRD
jgi:hypothetical protein